MIFSYEDLVEGTLQTFISRKLHLIVILMIIFEDSIMFKDNNKYRMVRLSKEGSSFSLLLKDFRNKKTLNSKDKNYLKILGKKFLDSSRGDFDPDIRIGEFLKSEVLDI